MSNYDNKSRYEEKSGLIKKTGDNFGFNQIIYQNYK